MRATGGISWRATPIMGSVGSRTRPSGLCTPTSAVWRSSTCHTSSNCSGTTTARVRPPHRSQPQSGSLKLHSSFHLLFSHRSPIARLVESRPAVDAPSAGRSNCNLPTLCNQCRGKDGERRPVADLMASIPCGFCRCATDLNEASYISLPAAAPPPPESV